MTPGTRPRQRLTLAVACMAQGMMVLDVLIVRVALPAMQHELHLLPAGLEWVVSGYVCPPPPVTAHATGRNG